ncbi:MAG: hypothetical protein ABI837_11495, partial [Acidobacteriota bacterium]
DVLADSAARVGEALHPFLITAEYRIARRPQGRVLVDYNQNAWGRTLASIYSLRPTSFAGASAPVTWEEVERGIRVEDFRIDNIRERVTAVGDLWKPVLGAKRFDLFSVFDPKPKRPAKKPAASRKK